MGESYICDKYSSALPAAVPNTSMIQSRISVTYLLVLFVILKMTLQTGGTAKIMEDPNALRVLHELPLTVNR